MSLLNDVLMKLLIPSSVLEKELDAGMRVVCVVVSVRSVASPRDVTASSAAPQDWGTSDGRRL